MTLSSKNDPADLARGHPHPGPLLVLVQLVVYHHLRLCLLKLHVIVPDIGLHQRQLLQVAGHKRLLVLPASKSTGWRTLCLYPALCCFRT